MNRKFGNRLAFWLGVGGALPFVYASSYAVNGAPPAEGCSGSGSESEVGVISLSAQDEAIVGRDAFFTFTARTNEIAEEEALAAITVTVTDESGAPVAGETRVLKRTETDDGAKTLRLGWTASGAGRTGGEELAFRAHAADAIESPTTEARLVVLDAEPELQLPSFDIFEFSAQIRDRGARETCEGGSCSSSSFGVELRTEVALLLIAGSPDPGVLVAWDFQFEAITGNGEFAEPVRPFELSSPDIHEWVAFSNILDEYCVRLVGTDLKTGTTKSAEICASPESELATTTYDSVGECFEPPPGLEERWCLANASEPDDRLDISREQQAMCDRLLESGAGGAAGEGGTPGEGGTGPEAPVRGGAGGSSGSVGTDPVPPERPPLPGSGATGNGEPDAGAPRDPEAGSNPGDDSKTTTVITEGGCGCRTAADPTGQNGVLAATGLLALAAGLGLRRRRER